MQRKQYTIEDLRRLLPSLNEGDVHISPIANSAAFRLTLGIAQTLVCMEQYPPEHRTKMWFLDHLDAILNEWSERRRKPLLSDQEERTVRFLHGQIGQGVFGPPGLESGPGLTPHCSQDNPFS